MALISIFPIEEISIGGCRFGFKCVAQLLYAASSCSSQSHRDGKSTSWPAVEFSDVCDRLVAKDRHEEAKAIVTKYHANGDSEHPLVHLEMKEMIASLQGEVVTHWKNFFDLSVLVKSRARRYRLMLNVAFAWFGQFSGNK